MLISRFAGVVVAVVLGCVGSLTTESQPRQVAVAMPPMGWSSWNSFSNTVDAQIVMAQAKAMATNGMKEAGYRYVNIDEGWWLGTRDSDGNIVVDEKAWPALAPGEKAGDMANIVRYIHSLGLKAGIYTDAGEGGCSMYPDIGPKYFRAGSEGHYEQDFLQFARWGFDYVKVDWCGGDKENLDPAVQYAEIARAIARAGKITGNHLFFSICEWGRQSPWTWAPNIGGVPADIWRTSDDIVAPIVAGGPHADRKASYDKMLANFDHGIHPEAQHTGFYNDPDMMVIGMPGLNDAQNRVHMSLWAISGAPLLVGADLTKLSPETLSMLTNPAVLAIDQDSLGLQAVKVAEPEAGVQVWSKPLAQNGASAVLVLNRNAQPQKVTIHWKDLGLADASAKVTNVWTGAETSADGEYPLQVPGADAVLLRVQGSVLPATTYRPDGNAAGPLCRGCELQFSGVAGHSKWARVQIVYANSGEVPVYATLSVNGENPTHIAFPPTGAAPGMVTIEVMMDRDGATNWLKFNADCDAGPAIDSITVQ